MKKCLLAFVCGFSLTAQTKIDWNTQLKNVPTRVTNAEMVPNKDINGGYVGRDATGNATIPGAVTAAAFTSSDTTHTSLMQMIPGLNTNFASAIGMGLWGMFLDSANGNKLTRQDSLGNKVLIEGAAGAGGGGIYAQAFTSAISVSLTHNMNLSPITGFALECFDGSFNLIYPSSAVAASANAITVTFAVATTGSCTVVGTGATGGGGGGAVTSVFTRTGAVVATTGDYTAAQVGALNDPGANGIVKRTAANTTGIAVAGDFPTLNQSTTGTAANVTGIVATLNGGTGSAVTAGAAGHVLRSNGTAYLDSAIQAADVPTLNQSTTGNAATATALAAIPTQCTGGQFATGVAASGNANCATPGGGGNVTGPGTTTNLYVPQWSGTTGTSLTAGLPVATTSTANALVETGAGGTINANFVPTLNQSTTGNASTATTATNVAGGAVGSIHYQSAVGTTAMLAGNTAATDQVLISHGTGTVSAAPALSNAPALSAANMTSFPTFNQSTTGNAATATALATTPTQCTGGQFATGVAASGNANCATPGGGGNVSGPGSSTNLYVPQWSGTTGTTLLAGLPVAVTATANALVETGAGGTINANFVPILNQNTTGTAANVTGIVLEANGGTGANNTTGAAGHYLRSNGTHYVDNTIQATDVPTLNQSTTGNATTATTATNVAGGALGSVPYQSAAATTALLAGNTAATDQVLVSHGTGAVSAAPTFANAPVLSAANMTAFPTLNQNTTGTAANVTGIVLEANGGTGANNTTGAAGHYLRSNGTHYLDNTIQVADVPTLNQSTTGTAALATSVAGGTAGAIHYQSAVGTTAFIPATVATLTDGATITWAIANVPLATATVTLGGNRTLNITNPVITGQYVLRVLQDATGTRGLVLGTGCVWKVSGGGAGAITPSTAANAIDVLAFYYDGTNCYANFNKNFN